MDAAEDDDELEEEYQCFWMGTGTGTEVVGWTGAGATQRLPADMGVCILGTRDFDVVNGRGPRTETPSTRCERRNMFGDWFAKG